MNKTKNSKPKYAIYIRLLRLVWSRPVCVYLNFYDIYDRSGWSCSRSSATSAAWPTSGQSRGLKIFHWSNRKYFETWNISGSCRGRPGTMTTSSSRRTLRSSAAAAAPSDWVSENNWRETIRIFLNKQNRELSSKFGDKY